MRSAALLLALLAGCGSSPRHAESQSEETRRVEWHTRYDDAVQEARQTGRPILASFTGSDWCSWCIKLEREVYAQPEFARWAARRVVLLELDYPRGSQPEAIRQQNDRLQRKYRIRGFPTVLFLDADGRRLAQPMGYLPGGPSEWVTKADSALGH